MILPDPVALALPAFVLLILAEMAHGRLTGRVRFETRDTLASLAMGFGNLATGILLAGLVYGAYEAVHEARLFDIGYALWAFPLCFVLEDLAYYWHHRISHECRWFWASHVVHHSSQHYNLSTALRQTWTGKLSGAFVFWLPLPLLGFPPPMVLFFSGVSLVYQFFIHTEAIGRLGPLERVLNTPSHHRVHHAVNPRYLDANYAGVLIIWDRMFGTFVAERAEEPPRYGIVKPLGTFNPLRIAFHEWIAIGRDLARARSAREALMRLGGPPGWAPGGGMTARELKARGAAEDEAPQKIV